MLDKSDELKIHLPLLKFYSNSSEQFYIAFLTDRSRGSVQFNVVYLKEIISRNARIILFIAGHQIGRAFPG